MQYKTLNDIKRIISSYEKREVGKDLIASDSIEKGLYLHLRQGKKGISKAFIFKYKVNSKTQKITIGKYPYVTLDKAREAVSEYKGIMQSLEFKAKGLNLKDYLKDLQDLKDKENIKNITFSDVFMEWLEKKNIREKTKTYYKILIKSFMMRLGNKIINEISKSDIIEFLQSYQEKGKYAICERIFSLIKQVFNYCVAYDYIDFSVCDRIKYNILFKKRDKKKHYKPLNTKELKEFIKYANKGVINDTDIHKYNKVTKYKTLDFRLYALMYKFNMYVPLRVSNIINLEWSEVDFLSGMLIIPACKMKNNKAFKLPLNTQALNILNFMYKLKVDNYVFSKALSDEIRNKNKILKAFNEYLELEKQGLINKNTKAKLANKYNLNIKSFKCFIDDYRKDNKLIDRYQQRANKAINKVIAYIDYLKFLKTYNLNTPHRIRSTFSTLLYDLTPEHKLDFTIIEMCLSHNVGNLIIQSYNHSERIQERKQLMQFWGDYIDKLENEKELKKVSGNDDEYILLNSDDDLSF